MTDFSGVSNQSLLGRLVRWPLALIPVRARIPILQGRLRGYKWIAGSSVHGCWLGSYEYRKQAIFTRWINRGDVVFDIGAHVGYYALLSSELSGVRGRVIAFEPLPRNLAFLRQHIEINDLSNVEIVEAAVSDESGFASFDSASDSHLGSLASNAPLTVRTVSLDHLWKEGVVPAPNLMKIDVEGGEGRVLRGAQCLLRQVKPIVFLATHNIPVHNECCQRLLESGYRLLSIDGEAGLPDRPPAQGMEILALPLNH